MSEHTQATIADNNNDDAAPETGAVIVTFNPDEAFYARLENIAAQVNTTIVVDNGSGAEFVARLRQYATPYPNIEIICFGTNRGIAAALNAGLDRLIVRGFSWGYTFDHDSLPMADFFRAMREAVGMHDNVAIFAPEYFDENSMENITPRVGNADAGIDLLSTMTSGNLVGLHVWSSEGKFDERFFIDYVDHEYCLRLKAAGYRIVKVASAVLAHNLGKRSLHGPSFYKFATTNHSALRRYYITRNRLRVYAKYARIFPTWVLNDIRSFAKETVKVVFFEEHRLRKVRAMILGVRDAVLGNWPSYKE